MRFPWTTQVQEITSCCPLSFYIYRSKTDRPYFRVGVYQLRQPTTLGYTGNQNGNRIRDMLGHSCNSRWFGCVWTWSIANTNTLLLGTMMIKHYICTLWSFVVLQILALALSIVKHMQKQKHTHYGTTCTNATLMNKWFKMPEKLWMVKNNGIAGSKNGWFFGVPQTIRKHQSKLAVRNSEYHQLSPAYFRIWGCWHLPFSVA